MFFHVLHPETGHVVRQGMIVGNPEPGWYLVRYCDRIGFPGDVMLVSIEDMRNNWLFYSTADEMSEALEYHLSHRNAN
jgi:hypothetical protein